MRSLLPLERELLRKGLGSRARAGDRCADCGRTPLIGETVHHYTGGALRCELCRPLSREEPVESALMHSGEGIVRVTRA